MTWFRRVGAMSGKVFALRPAWYALFYGFVIVAFALIDCAVADSFYEPMSKSEGGTIQLGQQAQREFERLVSDWLAALPPVEDLETSLVPEPVPTMKFDDYTIQVRTRVGLRKRDRSKGGSSALLRWKVEWPVDEHAPAHFEVDGVPASLANSIETVLPEATASSPVPRGKFVGPVGATSIQVEQGPVRLLDRRTVSGLMHISRDQRTAITRYNASCDGIPQPVVSTLPRFLYFSVVTITTLGYGDIVPVSDAARWLVAAEVILGVVLAGLFINSVGNRRQ